MPNLARRTRPTVKQELDIRAALLKRWTPQYLEEQVSRLYDMAVEAGDIREARQTLVFVRDTLYGKPATVIVHEESNVADFMDGVRDYLEGMGVSIVEGDVPDVGNGTPRLEDNGNPSTGG